MTPNEKLTAVLESSLVRNSILAVILFNAVILGLETSEAASRGRPEVHKRRIVTTVLAAQDRTRRP